MTRHIHALHLVLPAAGLQLAPLVLAPLVFAQPICLQPSLPRSLRRWLRPHALCGVGLLAEGLAVFGLGIGTVAVTDAGGLPSPAVVASGYMAMLLLLGGVLKPAEGAGTGLALRVLASAFVCMALAASQSAAGP